MTTDTMTKTETAAGVADYAHMLLKVSDIARSERFYVDLLGFKVRPAKPLADGRPFVPFTQGIALTSGGAKDSPQIDHIAFKAKDVRAIASAAEGSECEVRPRPARRHLRADDLRVRSGRHDDRAVRGRREDAVRAARPIDRSVLRPILRDSLLRRASSGLGQTCCDKEQLHAEEPHEVRRLEA